MPLNPIVLTDYELGQAMLAIESVHRLGKPIAEVGCRACKMSDLEHDLQECIDRAGVNGKIFFWALKEQNGFLRYGFFEHVWALDALKYLREAQLSVHDRAWISGLLYGYSPKSIQEYINTNVNNRG